MILADRQDETLAAVADAAGATLIVAERGSWKAGARAARRDWLLCLDDGDIPQEGWIRVLDRFVVLPSPSRASRGCGVSGRACSAVSHHLFAALDARRRSRASPRADEEVKARTPVRLPARIERDPVFG